MPLEVTVSDPVDTEDPQFVLISATVHDSEHPHYAGVFKYIADQSGKTPFLWLTSVAVEYRTNIPLEKRSRLALANVRDAPLARWDTAARAHILDIRGFRGITSDQLVGALGKAFETITSERRVDRLYPELKGSDKPADVRKRMSLLRLADIAAQYEFEARRGTTDPAAAIARDRSAKPSTVRSWLHRARQAGLLAVTSQQARKVIEDLPGETMPVEDTRRSEEE